MAKLKELRKEFNDIKTRGMKEGLTFHDYLEVKKIQNRINSLLCAYNQEWCDFYEEVSHLLSVIVSSDIFHTFTESNIEYIKKHAHLLPLVLANNKGQAINVSKTNYYFPCQFHLESTPSLRIKHVSNCGYCFGCGEK